MKNSYLQIGQHSKKLENVRLQYFKKYDTGIIRRQQQNLQIQLTKNGILLVLGLVYLKNKLKQSRQQKIIKQIEQLMFSIRNIDDEYLQYNNEQTIKGILCESLRTVSNNNTFANWINLINTHPVLVMCLVIYVRAKGIKQFENNREEYEYQSIGNEIQLLQQYNSQIRNIPLLAIINSLKAKVFIKFQRENQQIGKGDLQVRLTVNGQHIKFELNENQNEPQLNQVKNIISRSIQFSQSKQSKSMNKSTNDSMSRLTKTCVKCGKVKTTRFCECRKMTPTRPSLITNSFTSKIFKQGLNKEN